MCRLSGSALIGARWAGVSIPMRGDRRGRAVGEPAYLIRYGVMGYVGRFRASPDGIGPLERGQSVVIQTDRGVELGEVLIPLDEAGDSRVGEQRVLRAAGPDDLDRSRRRRGEPAGSLRHLPARPRGGGLALGPDRRRASTRRRRHGAPVPRPPPSRRRRDPGAIPHGVRPGCRARAGRGGRRGGSRAGRRRMRIGRMRIGRRLRRRRMQQQGRAGSRCCRFGLRLRLIATWRLRLLRPQRPGGRARRQTAGSSA